MQQTLNLEDATISLKPFNTAGEIVPQHVDQASSICPAPSVEQLAAYTIVCKLHDGTVRNRLCSSNTMSFRLSGHAQIYIA